MTQDLLPAETKGFFGGDPAPGFILPLVSMRICVDYSAAYRDKE